MALGDGIRRNIATVSVQERNRFRDAIIALNSRFFPGSRTDFPAGHVSYWFKQDEIHQATHVHHGPAFLPWHRELCNRFEAMLRELDPDLSLHYWDWNTDPHSLFSSSFMGSDSGDAGDPWLSAGFYNPSPAPPDNFRDNSIHSLNQPTPNPTTWSYALHANPADPPKTLTRGLAAGAPPIGTPGWPSDSDVLAQQTYSDMRTNLEQTHDNIHSSYIGGTISNPHTAFRDPFVFLLHSNVDRLFAMWQTALGHSERLDPNQVYGTEGSDPSITDALEPWAGTSDWPVRPWYTPENDQVVKNCKHPSVVRPPCYDTLPTYPTVVTRETQTITFNEVPEGETTVRAAVFSVISCDDVHFQITNGPTVLTGPPGTVFGTTPLGVSDTVPSTSDFTLAKAHLWISYKGTTAGDMATGTVTIHCTETNEDFVIPITAETIARPSVAVVIALDKSNSMNFASGITALPKRIDVLKYSAPSFVDVIQEGNGLGIVSFDHNAYDVVGVTGPLGPPPESPFDDLTRTNLKNLIASHTPNPLGNTSIGDAVEQAQNMLLTPAAAGYDKTAIIVFTDGFETAPKYISEVQDQITANVFAVALGTAQQIQPNALTELCNDHQGFLRLTGALSNDDLFRLNKYFLQILAGVTNEDIVVDPEGWINLGDKHRLPFLLNEADIGSDVILLTPAPQFIDFALEAPDGTIVDRLLANTTPGMSHSFGTNVAFYRMTLPALINGIAQQEGTWHAILSGRRRAPGRGIAAAAPAATQQTVHGSRYSLMVHSYSNLRMRARLNQTSYEPGAWLNVRAVLTEYGLPVNRRALVRAELARPDLSTAILVLHEAQPGIFEASVQANSTGVYQFRVRAVGATLRGQPFTREQGLTGAVWRGGDTPPPTGKDDPRGRDEAICHLLECLLGKDLLGKLFAQYGINPDAVLRCIRAFCSERLGQSSPSAHSAVGSLAISDLGELLSQPGAVELMGRLAEVVRRLGA
jgi:Common central domain of tyrosinase/von Willebrand factor type A domain